MEYEKKLKEEEKAFAINPNFYDEEMKKYLVLKHKKQDVKVRIDEIVVVKYYKKFKKISLETMYTNIDLWCVDDTEYNGNLEILKNNNYDMIEDKSYY